MLVGISLFLTLFVMAPTFKQINDDRGPAVHAANRSRVDQAIDRGQQPLRTFMFKQTRDSDLALFVRMADMPQPEDAGRHPDLRAGARRSSSPS